MSRRCTSRLETDPLSAAVRHASVPGNSTRWDGYLAGIWSTASSFAAVLRSFLNPSGRPLLSRALWDASSDGLRKSNLSIPRPVFTTASPFASFSFDRETTYKDEHQASGWTLLRSAFTRAESETGRKPGTLSWAGMSNSYWFTDDKSGVGGILVAQFVPFVDPELLKLRDGFETLVHSSVASL